MKTCSSPARILKRFGREADGVTAVEFGIIAPVMIFMMMGICELGLVMGAKGILDNAVFAASRTGKTGYSGSGQTQGQTITDAIKKAASTILDPAKITVTSIAYADYDSMQPEPFTDTNKNGVRDAGEPYVDVNKNGSYDKNEGTSGYGGTGQVVLYTATYNWKLMTPLVSRFIGTNGTVALSSRIVVKNEPY